MGNGDETKNEAVVSASLILHASRFRFRAAAKLGSFFTPPPLRNLLSLSLSLSLSFSRVADDRRLTNSRTILAISFCNLM